MEELVLRVSVVLTRFQICRFNDVLGTETLINVQKLNYGGTM
jgi:hypothetical protein